MCKGPPIRIITITSSQNGSSVVSCMHTLKPKDINQGADPSGPAPFTIHMLMCLRFAEFIFWLPAARTFPVLGKVFKRYAVMLCRVIYITADRADILSGSLVNHEIVFRVPESSSRRNGRCAYGSE